MKSKRGQGLPMNTIVIAALVLVVMVVLILIFTGRMGGFTQDIQQCTAKGGECVGIGGCTQGNIIDGKCPGTDVCCVKIAETGE